MSSYLGDRRGASSIREGAWLDQISLGSEILRTDVHAPAQGMAGNGAGPGASCSIQLTPITALCLSACQEHRFETWHHAITGKPSSHFPDEKTKAKKAEGPSAGSGFIYTLC